jgi:hypothetical protein
MLRPLQRIVASVLLAALASGAAHAESVLEYLPAETLGFAVVRNIEGANGKIEGVLKIFADLSDAPVPAPWPFIKGATGLGAGVNESGDALVAILGGGGSAEIKPLILLAVDDYSQFAGSIGGDASGEICRVTIAGEEVLAARRGGYAMLMNVEHRPTMETLLSAEPKAATYLAPVADWMGANDVTAMLTPTGVDVLTAMGQSALAAQRAAFEKQLSGPQFAPMLKQLQQNLKMYESLLGFFGAEVDSAAVALSIDAGTNVRISKRVVFDNQGQLAGLGDLEPLDRSPLTGFAAEPFVFAAGGPVPRKWGEFMSSWARRVSEEFSAASGFEKFTDEEWKKVEETWRATMTGVRSTGMVMLAGGPDDPLVSNIFGVTKVDDAERYLKARREAIELWNGLLKKSTSDIKMKYDLDEVEIAGKQGLLMTVDIAASADDPNVPMFGAIVKNAFGEDGKFRTYLVAADGETVVSGLASKEKMEQAVGRVLAGNAALVESAEVKTTASLLDAGAPWRAFVSPQGCVQWASRLMKQIISQFGGGVPEIPEYPKSPPVGISVNLASGQLHAEMVWPAETLKQLAKYIKTCMKNK